MAIKLENHSGVLMNLPNTNMKENKYSYTSSVEYEDPKTHSQIKRINITLDGLINSNEQSEEFIKGVFLLAMEKLGGFNYGKSKDESGK